MLSMWKSEFISCVTNFSKFLTLNLHVLIIYGKSIIIVTNSKWGFNRRGPQKCLYETITYERGEIAQQNACLLACLSCRNPGLQSLMHRRKGIMKDSHRKFLQVRCEYCLLMIIKVLSTSVGLGKHPIWCYIMQIVPVTSWTESEFKWLEFKKLHNAEMERCFC